MRPRLYHYIFILCVLNLNLYSCHASQDIHGDITLMPSLKMLLNTENLQEANQFKQAVTQDSLIIIDLDGTLIHEQAALKHPNLRQLVFQLSQKRSGLKKFNTLKTLWSFYKKRTVRLVEPEWLQILNFAQKRGATIIAFTRNSLSSIPLSFAVRHRNKEIQSLGLASFFEPSFKNLFSPSLPPSSFKERTSIFYEGILMTIHRFKGDTFKSFIESIKQHNRMGPLWPTNIILFEDKEEQIFSMRRVAKELNIPFLSFLYLKDQAEIPPPYTVLQAYILGTQAEWITEQQASDWLSKQPTYVQEYFTLKNIEKLLEQKFDKDVTLSINQLTPSWLQTYKDNLDFVLDMMKFFYIKIISYFSSLNF